MTRHRPSLTLVAALVAGARPPGGCTVGPNYQRPEMPDPARSTASSRARPRPSRSPTCPGGRSPKDPQLAGPHPRGDRQQPRPAGRPPPGSRRPGAVAGIARSFLFPEVGVTAGYAAEQVSRLSEPPQGDADDKTLPELERRLHALVGDRPLRPHPAARRRRPSPPTSPPSRAAAASSSRSWPTWPRRTCCCASSTCSSRSPGARVESNDETVEFYEKRLEGGVSNRLEVDQARGQPRAHRRRHPRPRAADRDHRERPLAAPRAGPRARSSAARRSATSTVPPEVPVGLPAALLERRPDVVAAEQLLVAANANVGAAKALFFPTISLTGLLGGDERGSRGPAEGRRERLAGRAPASSQPLFQGGRIRRNYEAAQARFEQAMAEYRKAALNAYREVADALVTIQKLGEQRTEIAERRRGAPRRRPALALPLRHRPLELPRDPDRRPAAVRPGAAARPDARRGAARLRPALPRARRRLAARAETAASTASGTSP